MKRRIAMYFAWDRTAEANEPIGDLNKPFSQRCFEVRRPVLAEIRGRFSPLPTGRPGGSTDSWKTVFFQNFVRFRRASGASVRRAAVQNSSAARSRAKPHSTLQLLNTLDTLIVMSFDNQRTRQAASMGEIAAVRDFSWARPQTQCCSSARTTNIGDIEGLTPDAALARQVAEFSVPTEILLSRDSSAFGGFGLSLMAGLGAPIRKPLWTAPRSH